MTLQFQEFLEAMDYLDAFHTSFKPTYGVKTALITLAEDRSHKETSVLALAFNTINHDIVLCSCGRDRVECHLHIQNPKPLNFGQPLLVMSCTVYVKYYRAVVPNLGPPDVLGLQLPEILAS